MPWKRKRGSRGLSANPQGIPERGLGDKDSQQIHRGSQDRDWVAHSKSRGDPRKGRGNRGLTANARPIVGGRKGFTATATSAPGKEEKEQGTHS